MLRLFWKTRRNDLKHPVSDEWKLDWSVVESPSSIMYRLARDRDGAAYVSVTRMPLTESYCDGFVRCVTALEASGALIERFGLDSENRGYIVWTVRSAKPLLYDSPKGAEARGRFLGALLAVEKLHEVTNMHGAFTENSFVVDDHNQVILFDVCRVADLAKESEVQGVLAPFRMPDVEGLEESSVRDVYSLGVLGLKIFGAQFPETLLDMDVLDKGLETLSKEAPRWMQSVVLPIVSEAKKPMCQTVSALISAIVIDERSHTEDGSKREDVYLEELAALSRRGKAKRKGFDVHTFITSPKGICVSGVGAIIALSFLGFLNLDFSALDILPEVKRANEPVVKPDVSAEFNEAKAFSDLDNPNVMKSSEKMRKIWQALVQKRTDTGHSTPLLESLASYVQGVGDEQEPQRLASLMKFLDPLLSHEEKAEKLEDYLDDGAQGAERFVVNLVHESGEMQSVYAPALRKALYTRGVSEASTSALSTTALLLMFDTQATLAESDVSKYATNLTDFELWELVRYHASKRTEMLPQIVGAALHLPDGNLYRQWYLAPLRKYPLDFDIPVSALLDSATKGVSLADVEEFLEWKGQGSEQVLIASLNSPESEASMLALSGLIARPIGEPLLARMVELVGRLDREKYQDYIPFLVLCGLRSSLSDGEQKRLIRESSTVLMSDSGIVSGIITSGKEDMLLLVLGELGDSIHPTVLLSMLDAKNPEVRKAALGFLQHVRVQSIRQAVLKKYFEENDEAVKALYAELGLLL